MLRDNREFKIMFMKNMSDIIVPFLRKKGFTYHKRFSGELLWFEKVSETIEYFINFQIKSGYINCFDFYINVSGKETEECPEIKDYWTFNSEIELKDTLNKIKNEITATVLPWFDTVKDIEIDFKTDILNSAAETLESMGFSVKTELYDRKIIYSKYFSNDKGISLVVILPFLRETNSGYDVIRFEYDEVNSNVNAGLLYYPETRKTKSIFISSLSWDDSVFFFRDENKFKEIVNKLVNSIQEHADKWFNENRPKKKPDTENWGIYPDLNDYPKRRSMRK